MSARASSRPTAWRFTRLACIAALAAASASACAPTADPRRQVVVVVDTDAPVPSWVDRLSIEVFDSNFSTRADARDFPMPNPSDWPLSFGVRPKTEGTFTAVMFGLRLRAYDSTHLRSIYSSRDATLGASVEQANPVSVIDRLARVQLDGDGVAHVRIVLRADCMGVAASVPYRSTCVTGPDERIDAPNAEADTGAASLVGTWTAANETACVRAPRPESGLHDEDVCVPGGIFVMGDSQLEGAIPYGDKTDPVPERIAEVSPFLLDRFEVSVGRFRAAMHDPVRPFVPPAPVGVQLVPGDTSPITCGKAETLHYCTWRGPDATPDPVLDELPLNCVSYENARAYCRWAGGDLPSEAEWEYAATRAFKREKSPFPWLGASPSCAISSFGRWDDQTDECGHRALCGPLPVGAPFGGGPPAVGCQREACVRDQTPGPLGHEIVGLAGNVSEWVRDLQVAYTADCWTSAPRRDPVCEVDASEKNVHMFRGGSWALASWLMNVVIRTGGVEKNPELALGGAVGFRCMREGGPP